MTKARQNQIFARYRHLCRRDETAAAREARLRLERRMLAEMHEERGTVLEYLRRLAEDRPRYAPEAAPPVNLKPRAWVAGNFVY